jgi:hypothetical protein
MKKTKLPCHGHRFPAVVISCAVRWYFRFQLSLCDIEERLFERGVVVNYQTVCRWWENFGTGFADRVKADHRRSGTTSHLDEMCVTLHGEPYLLWRAADKHGADSTSCCRSTATRRQPSASSSKYWPHAVLYRTRSSPMNYAAIGREKPKSPN